jgi:hypothetical protein
MCFNVIYKHSAPLALRDPEFASGIGLTPLSELYSSRPFNY